MSTAPDGIVQRIQRLLALAGNNPNEAEAAQAAAKAQELLAQYNLTVAQLDEEKRARGGDITGAKRVKEQATKHGMFKYQRKLWQSLADANFCIYWSQAAWTNGIYSHHKHYLVGREDNVVTVKLMGEYIEQAVARLGNGRGGKELHSFKMGAIDRICQRLWDKKAEMLRGDRPAENTAPGTTALTLRNVVDKESYENQCYLYGKETVDGWERDREERRRKWEQEAAVAVNIPDAEPEPETEAQRRKREAREQRENDRWRARQARERAKVDWNAYHQGAAAGNDVGLDAQIDRTRSKGSIE